jgi:hypothetical protein
LKMCRLLCFLLVKLEGTSQVFHAKLYDLVIPIQNASNSSED